MGSLTAFPEIIYKKTGIITSSVETISTPVVIEAVRKSLLPEMTLSSLTDEIKSVNPYIGRMVSGDLKNKVDILDPKIILTTCVTGQGAAIKVAHLLENTLTFMQEYNIKIKPMDIMNKFNISSVLSAEEIKNVVAVVGTIDLCIPDVIFIPIDELIIGDGIKVLEKAIIGIESSFVRKEKVTDENMFVNVLEKMLTFLNPTKAYNIIDKSFVTLTNLLGIKDTKQLKVRYIFHCCCMVERLLQNDILPYQNIEDHIQNKMDMYKKIKLSLINVEEVFGIVIPDTEIGYIIDLFDTL
jgi:transcriptional regulatory protein LevR